MATGVRFGRKPSSILGRQTPAQELTVSDTLPISPPQM
jgi:hypothetical protein